MHKDKFLTVYAVFDDKTQSTLKSYQDKIMNSGFCGHQSMDIPFHISLGSFPIEKKDVLINLLRSVAKEYSSFTVELQSILTFADKVLYIKPQASSDIDSLHSLFDCNYADGLPFVPHVTLLIDDESAILSAKQILATCFEPMSATITEIHLSEFFPTKFIASQKL